VTTLSAATPATADGDEQLRRIAAVATAAVWMLLLATITLDYARGGTHAVLGLLQGFTLYAVVALLAYGALGTALTRSRPRNLLGWLALGVACGHGLGFFAGAYGDLALERGWGGADVGIWVSNWVWVPGYWIVPTFLLLLFPDGRLPSPRWRPVAAMAAAGLVVSMAGWATMPYLEQDVPLVTEATQPVTLPFAARLLEIGGLLGIASAVAGIVALLVRHARASGAQRLQVRWVLLGGVATLVLLAAGFTAGPAGPPIIALGMVQLPVAMAIGVFRHRLWDVDVVINRSLVYGALTLLVLATYVATVSLLGGLLGRETGAPLVATALVALGVNPVRQRLQLWVNEALHGQREDPYTALARLVERLDAVDGAGSALDASAETVRRVIRAGYAAVEVRGALRSVAGAAPSSAEAVHVVPLTVRGEPVGTLQVAMPSGGESLETGQRQLLADLARHVAVAVHTEQLTADLQASRRSLVEAREEERRRIRRDLHDELGPTLASVAMRIEQAREADNPAAAAALDGLPEHVRGAVRSVRSLVENLRPAALDELGLAEALRAQMRHLSGGDLRFDVDIDEDLGVLSAAVDAAAYRIISEALANAVRHAAASVCRVTVRREGPVLRLEVADDGIGLDDVVQAGVGLRSMRERATEVGGVFAIAPRPSGGTVVRAELPVDA
jgi:two-component system, NarL family, sensor kinase